MGMLGASSGAPTYVGLWLAPPVPEQPLVRQSNAAPRTIIG